MIYLYIQKNTIRLLVLGKSLLGQYKQANFQKTHEKNLLEDGRIANLDIVASAIKEAITYTSPLSTSDGTVCLILPQESFEFARFEIPTTLSEKAVLPFIQDKIRSELKLEIEDISYDFISTNHDSSKKILFFAQENTIHSQFKQVFDLLGLKLAIILPETIGYFQLFEKTLRAVKKETLLFIHSQDKNSFGYLYDSSGLMQGHKITFAADLESAIKTKIDKLQKENVVVNRIVLSGKDSDQIRQDLFTKKTGVWTNPLKKIIINYYQDYLKQIILKPQESFPILEFDACLGAFFFTNQNKQFSMKPGKSKKKLPAIKNLSIPFRLNRRDIFIFITSFVITFVTIWSYPKISAFVGSQKIAINLNPTPTQIPSPEPTQIPTPVLNKETIKIKILNGGGVKGAAGKIKTHLQENGYSEILTGNADRFDYETTTIAIKNDKLSGLNQFISDLETIIAIDDKNTSELDLDDPADIILTIGADFE